MPLCGLLGCYNCKKRRCKKFMEFEIKADFEPKEEYQNALKLLLETDNAIQKLTPQEQQKLALEFSKYKCA